MSKNDQIDMTETEKVKEVRMALRKKNAEPKQKPLTTNEGGVIMKKEKETKVVDVRTEAEAILNKVCKELKIVPRRLNAMSTCKSGLGALQADGKAGGLKVKVGQNDILCYSPHSYLGYGRQHPGRYIHVTIIRWGDPNMEKAFRKALKDPKSSTQWAAELNFVPRSQGRTAIVDIEAKKARLMAQLEALKKIEKASKAKKPNTSKSKAARAISKVATKAEVTA